MCDEPYIEQSQRLCKKFFFYQPLRPHRKVFADLKKSQGRQNFAGFGQLDFFESPGLHNYSKF